MVLIDKNNPFGNYRLIPRGILWEPLSHLDRASCIFLTKSNGTRNPGLEQEIRNVNYGTRIVECYHRSNYFLSHDEAEILPL
jgi:tetraacyldisaccharide 4'-kinase